ncbi:5036_t:CDS:2, partial [Ambispora leptoticha]
NYESTIGKQLEIKPTTKSIKDNYITAATANNQEVLLCKTCYHTHYEYLDIEDPKAQEYYTKEGINKLTECENSEKDQPILDGIEFTTEQDMEKMLSRPLMKLK